MFYATHLSVKKNCVMTFRKHADRMTPAVVDRNPDALF